MESNVCYKNPTENVSINNRIKEATPDNTFTIKECITIRDHCLSSHSRSSIAILLYRYASKGGALGLQWNDVDFEHKLITISRTAATSGSGKKCIKQYTKTKAGMMRQIPLLPQLEQALLSEKRNSLFIIHTKKYDFYNPKSFNQKIYRKYIEQIPNVRQLGTHAFRHALVTHLGNQGGTTADISKIVGHGDTRVTEKIYWLYDMNKAGATMNLLPY